MNRTTCKLEVHVDPSHFVEVRGDKKANESPTFVLSLHNHGVFQRVEMSRKDLESLGSAVRLQLDLFADGV